MHGVTWKLKPLRTSWTLAALLAASCGLAPAAWAHKTSDAYMRVADVPAPLEAPSAAGAIGLTLSVALRDVDAAVEQLDADGDRQLTWGEVRQATATIAHWVAKGVQWQCDGVGVDPTWRFEALEQRTDGRYARMAAILSCDSTRSLTLRYGLMQGIDPTHRLLVAGTLGGQPVAAVLAPDERSVLDLRSTGGGALAGERGLETGATRGGFATLVHFVAEGVHHILEGYDHLAFLLALLLPISLVRPLRGVKTSHSNPDQRAGLKALLITVTCFTVGHSVTLVMAGLGWIIVSGNWVEPAIAISIGISALLNLFPVKGLRSSWLALGFGLVHGLGFSGVLVEAGVSGGLLVWALAGFNLGVEAGQLMVVALWCVASLLLARWALYRTVVVRGGSVALVVLSMYWTVQRVAFSN